MPITINGSGTISGASTLSTTVASPVFTTPTIDSAQIATVSGSAPLYAARAWVNFNGTGTVAIRASGNVSSITDNGTGLYAVNFTSAMPDANYAVAVACGRPTPSNDGQAGISGTPAPTTVQVHATTAGDTNFKDFDYMHVAIFR